MNYPSTNIKSPTKTIHFSDNNVQEIEAFNGIKIPHDDDFEDEDEEEVKENEDQRQNQYLELEEQTNDYGQQTRKKYNINRPHTTRRNDYPESSYNTPQKYQSSSRRTRTSPDRMEPDDDNPTNLNDDQLKIQRLLYEKLARKNKHANTDKVDVFRLGTEDDLNNPRPIATTDDGLPQRMIDSIITNRFDRSLLRTEDPSKLECSICCTDFKDGEEIKILQCLHTHHKTCIDTWFTKKSVCPDCKFNMRTLNMNQLI